MEVNERKKGVTSKFDAYIVQSGQISSLSLSVSATNVGEQYFTIENESEKISNLYKGMLFVVLPVCIFHVEHFLFFLHTMFGLIATHNQTQHCNINDIFFLFFFFFVDPVCHVPCNDWNTRLVYTYSGNFYNIVSDVVIFRTKTSFPKKLNQTSWIQMVVLSIAISDPLRLPSFFIVWIRLPTLHHVLTISTASTSHNQKGNWTQQKWAVEKRRRRRRQYIRKSDLTTSFHHISFIFIISRMPTSHFTSWSQPD